MSRVSTQTARDIASPASWRTKLLCILVSVFAIVGITNPTIARADTTPTGITWWQGYSPPPTQVCASTGNSCVDPMTARITFRMISVTNTTVIIGATWNGEYSISLAATLRTQRTTDPSYNCADSAPWSGGGDGHWVGNVEQTMTITRTCGSTTAGMSIIWLSHLYAGGGYDGTTYSTIPAGPAADTAPTGTANSCTLSDAALVRIARGAGFAEADLQKAVAIALAESGGRVNALHGNVSGGVIVSYDIGLWQVNDKAHTTYDPNLLYTSPGYNATAAYQIFSATSGGGWGNWATYNSGAYNKYMTRAANAIQLAPSGTLGGNACADLSGGDIASALDGGGTTNPDGSDNGCGWSLNLFKDIKCGLQWAFVPDSATMTSWQDQYNTIKTNPPVSTATSIYASVTNIIGAFNDPGNTNTDIGSSSSCSTSACEGYGGQGLWKVPHVSGTSCDNPCFTGIPVIGRAGDMMQSSTWGHAMFLMMQALITLGFAYYWYNRLTSAIGSKADV